MGEPDSIRPGARIRAYRAADTAALYHICLRTGDSGQDATGQYADPDLLGHIFVGPYLALEPRLVSVLDRGDGTPLGYALGAADTGGFEQRCEREWWPPLRYRYPDPEPVPVARRSPDQRLAALIHRPPHRPAAVTGRYPSHLHIDLLPEAQGQGWGRALMERLLAALAATGSTGVHLGVARANERAVAFYRRFGFTELERFPGAFTMGRRL